MRARFAGCLADSRSVCRPEVPPFVENTAPEPASRASTHFSMMLHVASHEVSAGRLSWRAISERRCLSPCHSARANGRVGS